MDLEFLRPPRPRAPQSAQESGPPLCGSQSQAADPSPGWEKQRPSGPSLTPWKSVLTASIHPRELCARRWRWCQFLSHLPSLKPPWNFLEDHSGTAAPGECCLLCLCWAF